MQTLSLYSTAAVVIFVLYPAVKQEGTEEKYYFDINTSQKCLSQVRSFLDRITLMIDYF